MLELIANALAAIKEFLGFAAQKDAQKNTAPMQAAAEAQKERQQADDINQALAKNDKDSLRKYGAE